MLTETEAREFARRWVRAWNSHDLDAIMSHYGAEVVLTSPVAAKLLNDASGRVAGEEALRAYFKVGLAAYPNLAFELLDVMCGVSSVVLYYVNQKGTKTGEFMEFDAGGRVVRAWRIIAVDLCSFEPSQNKAPALLLPVRETRAGG